MERQGILYVVSAPSGAGKTTLCDAVVDIYPSLGQSVSFTTRQRRGNEVDGVDYHFVSRERFDAMVAGGEFVEWAEVHGNCYGTALATLRQAQQQGRDILLDIDVQGAAQLKRQQLPAVFVFIAPPSLDELRRRLAGRATDSEDVIAARLENARGELEQAHWYDYIIINDQLDAAVASFAAVIAAERCRTGLVYTTLRQRLGLPAAAGIQE